MSKINSGAYRHVNAETLTVNSLFIKNKRKKGKERLVKFLGKIIYAKLIT